MKNNKVIWFKLNRNLVINKGFYEKIKKVQLTNDLKITTLTSRAFPVRTNNSIS